MSTITGKVTFIGQEKQINERFKKREFSILTNDNFPQEITLQFVQDKCFLADKLKIGENVVLSYNIKGKRYSKDNGETYGITSLECWKIDIDQATSPAKSPSENDDWPL